MPVQLQSQTGGDEGDEARIEVIPLIDIMFFLLAAFMLVSLSMTHLRRVPVDLPEAATAVDETVTPPYQIAVDEHGVITWEGEIVTPTEISGRLRAASPEGEGRVMIAADEDARHKHVMAVLDAVRAAGVEQINFETKP